MSEEITKDNTVDAKAKLLADLKQKADLLGVSYNAKIGFDKLKLKLDLFLEDQEGSEPVNETSAGPNKSIHDIEKEAKRPILAKVKDLDPSQQGDPTIVTNIGNKFFKIGCITQKNKEQLIPKAVIEALEAKTMVEWQDEYHAITKRPTGNKLATTTKRYAIQIIDENPEVK